MKEDEVVSAIQSRKMYNMPLAQCTSLEMPEVTLWTLVVTDINIFIVLQFLNHNKGSAIQM